MGINKKSLTKNLPMTTLVKPVAFEIEVAKTSPSQDPAVKKRLEEHCQAAPSLEDIQSKLERAEAKREELTKKAFTDDKVVEVRWRKSTREAQQIARFKKDLLKLESADETRQRHLRTKIEKAQRNSCLLVVERKNTELASLQKRRSKSSRLLRNSDSKVSSLSSKLLARTLRSLRRLCRRSKSSNERRSTRPKRSSRKSKPDHLFLQMWLPARPRSILRKSKKSSQPKRKDSLLSKRTSSPNSS